MKLRERLRQTSRHFLSSRYFFRNFLLLFLCILTLCSAFALYTYRNSRQIIESEFLSSSQNQVETLQRSVDDFIKDARYIMAILDTEELCNLYFHSKQPDLFLDGIHLRLQEQLKSYCSRQNTIDSIYLYSGVSQTILTSTEYTPISYFSDDGWIEYFQEDPQSYLLFPRCKNGVFPYLLCLMKQISYAEGDSAIVINLNLSKLAQLQPSSNHSQSLYLITDDQKILYRSGQQELLEPLSSVSFLSQFHADKEKSCSLFNENGQTYTYAQIHSSEYPWSYVIVTELSSYASRLSSVRVFTIALFFVILIASIFLSLFFTFRAAQPIRSLMELIQSPKSLPAKMLNDQDITYIAQSITTYMQSNQQLSDELSARIILLNKTRMMALQSQINPHFLFNTLNMIHLLETEALGYQHKVPKLTLSLSRLLHYAIESTDLVTMETEMNFTRNYLDILNMRYGGQLNISIHMQEDIQNALVPKLFIQPIVENAVFHGLSDRISSGNSQLNLSFSQVDNQCCLLIQDNGAGMDTAILEKLRSIITDLNPNPKDHIGLHNVILRMNLLYGDSFHVNVESEPEKGSSFYLYFPYKR